METKSLKSKIENTVLYSIFSKIKLDIEGSNLENTGWMPSESDKKYMTDENYLLMIDECNRKNEKVMFKNVSLQWDSCDCGDGYGCSHGSFVYEIIVDSGGKKIDLELEEDMIYFNNDGAASMPIACATIWDFWRMCEMVDIELELSDYAISLLNKE